MLDFSLVLPVLNEEDIIIPVVTNIIDHLEPLKIRFEIILVENESTDNSLDVILHAAKKDKRIKVVQTKKGYGSAVIAGINAAEGTYIGYMPSDGQIDTSILATLWHEMEKGNVDVVKIYRKNRESSVRFFRSKIFNILTRLLYPISVKDINGSPRILSRENLTRLDLQQKDSFIDVEFTIKAHILQWKTKEFAMKNLNRLGGKSTVQFATVIEFLRNLKNYKSDKAFLRWKEKYIPIKEK